MARIKRGVIAHARHKKILHQSQGYYSARSRIYRSAYQAVIRSGQYAYRDRKQKKRKFRQLWITRINAATRQYGMSYNQFIHGIKLASIQINRKMLSNIAIFDKKSFLNLVNQAKLY